MPVPLVIAAGVAAAGGAGAAAGGAAVAGTAAAAGSTSLCLPISAFFSRFAMIIGATLMMTRTTVIITTTRVEMALMLGFTRLLMV